MENAAAEGPKGALYSQFLKTTDENAILCRSANKPYLLPIPKKKSCVKICLKTKFQFSRFSTYFPALGTKKSLRRLTSLGITVLRQQTLCSQVFFHDGKKKIFSLKMTIKKVFWQSYKYLVSSKRKRTTPLFTYFCTIFFFVPGCSFKKSYNPFPKLSSNF